MEIIGERLKQALYSKGLNVKEVSTRCGFGERWAEKCIRNNCISQEGAIALNVIIGISPEEYLPPGDGMITFINEFSGTDDPSAKHLCILDYTCSRRIGHYCCEYCPKKGRCKDKCQNSPELCGMYQRKED